MAAPTTTPNGSCGAVLAHSRTPAMGSCIVLWGPSTGHVWKLLSHVQGVKPWARAPWAGHCVCPDGGLGTAVCPSSSGNRIPLRLTKVRLSCSGSRKREETHSSQTSARGFCAQRNHPESISSLQGAASWVSRSQR